MAKLFDRVGQATATTGTGTITLGAVITDATNGDLATFADMGAVATNVVNYLAVDGNNWEIGEGTLGGTGPGFTLTRTVAKSKISGVVGTTPLTLSGNANVYSVPANVNPNAFANPLTSIAFEQTQGTLTDASPIAWDVRAKQSAIVTLGASIGATRQLGNPTNMIAGTTYALVVKQDATGSRALTYGTAYKWPGGSAPVLSTAANAIDVLTFVYDGTSMLGVAQKAFA